MMGNTLNAARRGVYYPDKFERGETQRLLWAWKVTSRGSIHAGTAPNQCPRRDSTVLGTV